MAGLYIHIPFCRKACHYCDFHFSTSTAGMGDVLEAIHREIDATPESDRWRIETLYLGGGTPSLIGDSEIGRLLDHLRSAFPVEADAEVTLEANPDDITPGRVGTWRSAGVNRLSIGIQSFRDEDLQWMNRAHNASQALRCVEIARMEGVSNLSIDLIYGIPGMDDADWHRNLDTALALDVPHLSAYALTVEPRTALHAMVRSGKTLPPSDERQAEQFLILSDRMRSAGYEHYEVSNFAKPGMRSRHNGSYWQGVPYLGFGPSAHSFDGSTRRWNLANNTAYARALLAGLEASESETVGTFERLNEYLMTSLRTVEGIDLARISKIWGEEERDRIGKEMDRQAVEGKAEKTTQGHRLTPQGWLFADAIAARMFKVP
jgi:oxygen-independent coproporphyrinogen-3 oxidase